MNVIKYFYRFKPIGIDCFNERDIRKYNKELTSFDELFDQFHKLKAAFDNASKERADIVVNVLPDISGVVELLVYHNLQKRLFSKGIKKQCFTLCITKYNSRNEIELYDYETVSIKEVELILNDFITKQKLPELDKWNMVGIF